MPLFILASLSNNTQKVDVIFFCFILMIIGAVLLGIAIKGIISYDPTKKVDVIITNQRVLIYPSPYAERNRPKIINLAEVNGDIEMKCYKGTNTGSIYIPSPHHDRLNYNRPDQNRKIIFGKEIIEPDIKGIKDPYKVYNILIEAIQVGKKSKWKFSH